MAKRTRRGEPLAWLHTVLETPWPVCVEWPYYRERNGYAIVEWDGRNHTASSVACRLAHGPRPPGMECCHSCHNRACVNPRHLRWDTHQANSDDRLGNGTYFLRRNGRRADGSVIH